MCVYIYICMYLYYKYKTLGASPSHDASGKCGLMREGRERERERVSVRLEFIVALEFCYQPSRNSLDGGRTRDIYVYLQYYTLTHDKSQRSVCQ